MRTRTKITDESINIAIRCLENKLDNRLNEKGNGTFVSIHEGLGIITEEYHELLDAVRNNDIDEIEQELIDIEVGCLFLRACIQQKTIDW